MRIGIPAVGHLGEANFVLAERFAVRFLGVLAIGRTPSDVGVDNDERRTYYFAPRRADGHVDQIQIVHVGDMQDVPVPGAEARGYVVAEGERVGPSMVMWLLS